MTKRILSTVAAAAILTTGAMAFDSFGSMEYNTTNNATETTQMAVADNGFGQALIFPAYFVGGGWQTTLRVINTGDAATVAKVVLYAGSDSHEVRDFNIYLSAHDEWVGTIKIDPTDNKAKIISTDESAPLLGGGMASSAKPMVSGELNSNSGYVEVIGCASTTSNNGAHQLHAELREAYQNLAKTDRNFKNIGTTTTAFKNGVLYTNPNGVGTTGLVPLVNLTAAGDTSSDNNGSKTFTFTAPSGNLIGDVRMTNTENGTDMDMPAVALGGVTTANNALLFVEGEAANVLDRDIDGNTTSVFYNQDALNADSTIFDHSKVYMTYGGTTSFKDNYLLVTNPFKRIAIENHVDGSYGETNATKGTGSLSITPSIYNQKEDIYTPQTTTQFSPANTFTGAPIMKLYNEVSATESSHSKDSDTISYYLGVANQDSNNNYQNGYVILQNIDSAKSIPGIVTQMLATQPKSGTVVTNWVPAHAN